MFPAGLGAYVFFNATTFPTPVTAAGAFAVLYLPYSMIGPFAGVFIDRWSRRQILVWSALVRAVFVTLTAALVAAGSLGVPLYIGVLAVLGVSRFFLCALSAAMPHAVAAGLAEGARHVMRRPPAAAALLATAGQRTMYGILFLMSILLYRNYFYHASANNALGHFTLVIVAAALGYGAAAVLTPILSPRLPEGSVITIMLLVA